MIIFYNKNTKVKHLNIKIDKLEFKGETILKNINFKPLQPRISLLILKIIYWMKWELSGKNSNNLACLIDKL